MACVWVPAGDQRVCASVCVGRRQRNQQEHAGNLDGLVGEGCVCGKDRGMGGSKNMNRNGCTVWREGMGGMGGGIRARERHEDVGAQVGAVWATWIQEGWTDSHPDVEGRCRPLQGVR